MIRASFVLVAVTSLAAFTATACKGKDKDGGGSAAKSGEKSGGGAAAATKLPKVDNLTIDVPGEVTVSDGIMGDGNMLQGEDVGAFQVEPFKTPQTADEAKADADMYTPKNLKIETLSDGWAMTFENTGSMGTNYWVTVRRDIGGKPYKCSSTQDNKDRSVAVLAACKSLKK